MLHNSALNSAVKSILPNRINSKLYTTLVMHWPCGRIFCNYKMNLINVFVPAFTHNVPLRYLARLAVLIDRKGTIIVLYFNNGSRNTHNSPCA